MITEEYLVPYIRLFPLQHSQVPDISESTMENMKVLKTWFDVMYNTSWRFLDRIEEEL